MYRPFPAPGIWDMAIFKFVTSWCLSPSFEERNACRVNDCGAKVVGVVVAGLGEAGVAI